MSRRPAARPGPSAARAVYLEAAYDLLRRDWLPEAPPRERVALAYSFPTRRARTGKDGTVTTGQCHFVTVEGSATGEDRLVTVHPCKWTAAVEVLAVLAHEAAHAALPRGTGHRAPFVALVRRMGLEGKPTETRPGPAFRVWADAAARELPPFPAGAVELTGVRVQGTRQRLYECACRPPVKVRAARDDLEAQCLRCECLFELRQAARPDRGG